MVFPLTRAPFLIIRGAINYCFSSRWTNQTGRRCRISRSASSTNNNAAIMKHHLRRAQRRAHHVCGRLPLPKRAQLGTRKTQEQRFLGLQQGPTTSSSCIASAPRQPRWPVDQAGAMLLAVQPWAVGLGAATQRLEASASRVTKESSKHCSWRQQASARLPQHSASRWHVQVTQRPRRRFQNLPALHCLQPDATGKGELELPADKEDLAVGSSVQVQDSNGAGSGDSGDEGLPRRTVGVQFKCNKCGATSVRYVNPVALTKGTIFLQCANCNVIHKIVDNLNLIEEYHLNGESDGPVNTDPEIRYNVELKMKSSDGNTEGS